MNFYEIGYYTYEESEFIQLQHDATFSENELEEMIILIAKDAATLGRDYYPKNQDNIVGELIAWEDYKMPKHQINYASINWAVGRLLCERYGFSPLPIIASWHVQGWNNIYKPSWLEGHTADNDADRIKRFSEAVNEPDA